ncbi:MAG: cation:proton antiporter [Holosporales bacterium]|jgi:CPA2 family monovalent cation:H+ antiporter-2|nr:cation:proton antiporter [Holosporales bacterium]
MTEEVAILQIAIVAFVALASGFVAIRLRQPAILGYVLTGVILGPSCCALIPSREQITILAELGVLLLLFVIGIELNIQTFKKHILLSSSCVLLQIVCGLTISFLVSLPFDWPAYFTVALGFVGALSSTAVVVNTLERLNMLHASTGSLAIGILIAQDIAVIPMILTLNALTCGGALGIILAKVIASIAFIVVFVACLSRTNKLSFDPTTILGTNKDLYMLTSLSVCFAAAAVAGGIGLTSPYGAFLAGLALGNLNDKGEVFAESIRPIQKILLMVFFLSIGLLLDLQFVWNHFWVICLLLVIVTVVKTLTNIVILRVLKVRLVQASFIGVALAQLGEFAFLLTTVFDNQPNNSFDFAEKCLIALTVLSLIFSPFWLKITSRLNIITNRNNIDSSKILLKYLFGKTIRMFKTSPSTVVEYLTNISTRIKNSKNYIKRVIIPQRKKLNTPTNNTSNEKNDDDTTI